MATIKSTLKLQDKMSSVFKNIIKYGNDSVVTLNVINEKTKQTSKSMNMATSSSNSLIKSLMGFSLVKNGISMITSQLDSAINRLDTINNYPKVMSNLGIGNAESTASIERLKNGLDGIPTKLDDAVLAVQKFASVNNNLGASTEMFLALNNAILAGRCKYYDTTNCT